MLNLKFDHCSAKAKPIGISFIVNFDKAVLGMVLLSITVKVFQHLTHVLLKTIKLNV